MVHLLTLVDRPGHDRPHDLERDVRVALGQPNRIRRARGDGHRSVEVRAQLDDGVVAVELRFENARAGAVAAFVAEHDLLGANEHEEVSPVSDPAGHR